MIPWFIWVIVVCTPIAITSRILLDRLENKKIRQWNKECSDHLNNQNEKTLPKGFGKQNTKGVVWLMTKIKFIKFGMENEINDFIKDKKFIQLATTNLGVFIVYEELK